jgi:hypothetical protein
MTPALAFKQATDLHSALANRGEGSLSGEKLIGRWLNTNRDTKGIAECAIAGDGEGYTVSISGVGEAELIDWPQTKATVLVNLDEEAGQRAVALSVDFDFSFMRVESHIRVNKGVLVIVVFFIFKDDSGRSNYLTREFFSRAD